MAEKSMIRGDWRDVIEVADNLEELAKLCEARPSIGIIYRNEVKRPSTENKIRQKVALRSYKPKLFLACLNVFSPTV